MDDLDKFIEEQKKVDSDFAKDFEEGYKSFKIGVLLQQARKESGITQELLAAKLSTKKSAISRIENHAEDICLSTIYKYVDALGKTLNVSIK